MSIGTTIKRLRRDRDITQEQLAEYLGISTGAVSQWECDRTAPDITQLPLLANIFDVSADELLEIDGKKKDEIIQVFLEKYDELSNKGDLMSRFDLTKEAYRKYPNDYRVIEKYRYLNLRHPQLQSNLRFRHALAKSARDCSKSRCGR